MLGVRALGIYNDKYLYILSVTDVFSSFLHLVPLKSKTGTAVSSAFQSIFKDPRYSTRRPIGLRTDKGKEFLNRQFQDTLKREGIQFEVFKNPDVKCSVVERAHRTILDRLYKYFTYKNTYRYIDVLPNLSKLTTIRLTLPLAWHRLKFPIRTSSLYGREWRRRGEAYASFG